MLQDQIKQWIKQNSKKSWSSTTIEADEGKIGEWEKQHPLASIRKYKTFSEYCEPRFMPDEGYYRYTTVILYSKRTGTKDEKAFIAASKKLLRTHDIDYLKHMLDTM